MDIKIRINLLLLGLFALIISSCNFNKRDKTYSISQNGNNLYIAMPHPEKNENGIDWKGVFLSDVVEDVYQKLRDSSLYGECSLYVRLEKILLINTVIRITVMMSIF